MTKGYMQIYDGEWIRPLKRGFINQCCDCHLVHVYDFEIFDPKTEMVIPGAAVQFKVRVDRRKTAASRRKLKFEKD